MLFGINNYSISCNMASLLISTAVYSLFLETKIMLLQTILPMMFILILGMNLNMEQC